MKNRRQGQSRLISKKEISNVIQMQRSSRHASRNICLLNMSIFTGCRVSELANLQLGDVVNEDWSMKKVVVLKKYYTKTKKNREIYLSNSELQKSLHNYISEIREQDGNRKSNPFLQNMKKYFQKPLYVSQKGTAFSPRTMQRLFKNMYKQVGLDDQVSSHSGRRTFISNLISQGIDLKLVSTLAGHSSIQTTVDTYAVANPNKMVNVCKNLNIF